MNCMATVKRNDSFFLCLLDLLISANVAHFAILTFAFFAVVGVVVV